MSIEYRGEKFAGYKLVLKAQRATLYLLKKGKK